MTVRLSKVEHASAGDLAGAGSPGVATLDLESAFQGAASSRREVQASSCGTRPKWYVLWTRCQCEQAVYEQLSDRGFHLFFPTCDIWARRNGSRYRATVPMFPGYLFLNHVMDKTCYIEVTSVRGVVKVLGDRWDALADVPEREIAAIQRIHHTGVPAVLHPHLRVGERVRIVQGLLEGIEGILVRTRPDKGLVVVSVNLLRRSVAVEVDYTLVALL